MHESPLKPKTGLACMLMLIFKIENSMVVETKKWGRVVKDNHK
jgi:hypothetical protein